MEQGKLNPKQEAFVREYVVDFNATQAAIRAGYSPRTAQEQSSVLLSKPIVQAAVEKAKAKVADRAEVTADEIINELRAIAFAKVTDAASWRDKRMTLKDSEELSTDTIASISSIDEEEIDLPKGGMKRKVKIKHYDKIRALELLGRYRGLFVDRHEVSGKDGKPIQVEQKSWLDVIAEEQAAQNKL